MPTSVPGTEAGRTIRWRNAAIVAVAVAVAALAATAWLRLPSSPTPDREATVGVASDGVDRTEAEAAPTGAGQPGRPLTATTAPREDERRSDTVPAGAAARAPAWLGQRVLPTTPDGRVVPQTTPTELVDRRFVTVARLSPPPDSAFTATIDPLEGEPLTRSTWSEGCPVGPEELAYLTVSFWGFDGGHHRGELIVGREVAADIVEVFRRLHEARFPIEEMRIVTPDDLAAEPTGDGNNTTSFVCRPVTGGTSFSEHAYGLAIDINPFHNPYQRGDLVLPELAGHYLDRSLGRPGMIQPGDVVVEAFAEIGWSWGGDWRSLKDYQHFSRSGR